MALRVSLAAKVTLKRESFVEVTRSLSYALNLNLASFIISPSPTLIRGDHRHSFWEKPKGWVEEYPPEGTKLRSIF